MRARLLIACALALGCESVDVLGTRGQPQANEEEPTKFPNLLEERQQVPISRVNAQLNDAFVQLFFGDPQTEAVFRDQGDGSGYVEDIANGDVRTDSMGYGMLVTVQLNQREVFDKLWAWVKAYMRDPDGPSEGLLRWRCNTMGQECATTAATDASSIIVTSLFMASTRWGSGSAHDYETDGRALLSAMMTVEERNSGATDGPRNLFDLDAALPRHGSMGREGEVPVDYLMPSFYEIWAKHDVGRASYWKTMAENSRALLARVAHPTTGLLPEAITYEGDPVSGRDAYRTTTSRTYLNLAVDHMWNGPSAAVIAQNERVLDFFLAEGIDEYVVEYSRVGEPLVEFNTIAHQSLVALAAGTSRNPAHDVFLEKLLEFPIPEGDYRYYDGMLYILSLLALSGQMTPE